MPAAKTTASRSVGSSWARSANHASGEGPGW